MKLPSLEQLSRVTRTLAPLIKFFLYVGAGIVMTSMAIWMVWLMAYKFWPTDPASQVEIIKGIAVAIWICLAVNGLVVLTLAFGRPEKISLSGGMVSGELRFDDDEEHGRHG